mmetsp:Transcript_14365/g.32084  ORF Transcript_14365/g.32084 Transcript_14365/m.32084 type:complete len:269 (-) Transcript_14365:72-878(-)
MLLLPQAPKSVLTFALAMSARSSDSTDQSSKVPVPSAAAACSAVPRVDSIEPVASTKWLSLQTISYTDQEGTARKWDVATRTTKKSVDKADAVVIIPLLRRHDVTGDGSGNTSSKVASKGNDDNNRIDTLLVEQYRPPVGKTTIEFPAGLIDDGETPEEAALRELREETGYVGERCRVVPQVSPQVCMSPGLTDESVHVVVVEVDLNNPYNHGTPKPNLDDGEHVTVKRVELNAGLKEVLEKADGNMPIMGLYLFAVGLELGASLSFT